MYVIDFKFNLIHICLVVVYNIFISEKMPCQILNPIGKGCLIVVSILNILERSII